MKKELAFLYENYPKLPSSERIIWVIFAMIRSFFVGEKYSFNEKSASINHLFNLDGSLHWTLLFSLPHFVLRQKLPHLGTTLHFQYLS